MLALIITAFEILGIGSAIHAVMSTRTSQGAIAWGVSLVAFPYLAVPAYWVFGRSQFQGYVTARRTSDGKTPEIGPHVETNVQDYIVPDELKSPAGLAAERLAEMPSLSGNKVELLIDGEATFGSIFEGIDRAKDYILFQFFIVKDDELGREAKARLLAKAREGVRVYFLYDEVGSNKLPNSYTDELRDGGVEVFDFHTRKGPSNRFQINFRNHRKIVVVDGDTAWIGGHNVGDEYMGKDPKFGRWRDTHVRIDGPAALAAQLSFMEDWHWATESILDLNWEVTPVPEGDTNVLVIPTGPADELETAGLMFIHAINSAKERIWIASPYFVPDEAVVSALLLAGLRGVDVRILIPEKADHLAVWLAAFSYFDEAGRTGVKFYKFTDGFLHQKAMLIDDVASSVGTANFDNRSFRLNFEITAFIGGPEFASLTKQMFEDDFANSRLVPEGEYRDKPWWFKFGVKLARLTAPVQ